MRKIRIIEDLYDDLDWAADQTETPATETITLTVDGETVQLELSAANAQLIRDTTGPWMKAGSRPRRKTAVRRLSYAEYARMHNMKYRTPAGHYSYNNELRRLTDEFNARLAAGEETQ